MADKLIDWLIKKLILLKLKRQPEWMAWNIGVDERCDVHINVSRYYDDYYTIGTLKVPYFTEDGKRDGKPID